MELDSIECVSSIDGLEEDETNHHPHSHHHHQFSSSKPHNAANNNHNNNATNIAGPTAIAPATNVHELLECPVCTNSMYPPIHQVYISFRVWNYLKDMRELGRKWHSSNLASLLFVILICLYGLLFNACLLNWTAFYDLVLGFAEWFIHFVFNFFEIWRKI